MSLIAHTALLKQALQVLTTDPTTAAQLIDRANAMEVPVHAALSQAWATLARAQLAWVRGAVQRGQVPALSNAARIFRVNDHFDEEVRTLALASHLAAVQGDIALSIQLSVRAFRELRAAPGHRLLAARAILWNVPQAEDRVGRELLTEIRQLAATAPASLGKAVAGAYIAYRDFKRLLSSAGIATDTDPFPPPATTTVAQARAEARRMVAPIEHELPVLRACLPTEPVPLLLTAAMVGFAHGSERSAPWVREVALACGDAARAYVDAARGVVHLRNGEHDQALAHLDSAWASFVHADRADEGRPWLFYRAQALRAVGRYEEALAATDRFLALAPPIAQPWRRAAMVIESLPRQSPPVQGERRAMTASPAHARPRPPHVTSALRWMTQHLQAPLRVPDIVAAVGVSRRTLETGFRDYLNRSVADELRWLRMQKALQLLRASNPPLSEVRRAVGYASASAFSRDFRRVFGVVPSHASVLLDGLDNA